MRARFRAIPWLGRRVPALIRRGVRLRGALLDELARLQIGEPVFARDQLADRLAAAATSRWIARATLRAIVDANLVAHGADAVDRAADAAMAATGERGRRKLAAALADCLAATGHIVRPLALVRALPDSDRAARRAPALARQAALLERDVPFGPPVVRAWQPVARRVLYHTSSSLPHHTSGYAIRTHWLARTLRGRDWDLVVQNRLGYPVDRHDFIGVAAVATAETIDGVPYRFAPDRARGFAALDIEAYQRASVDALLGHAAELRPAILHSASNYLVGLAGAEAARRLGIPSIYEVRGLWHLTRAARQPAYAGSDHHRLTEKLEVQAAASSDHVFAITDAVAEVLIAGGVPASRVTILPNAVDLEAFAPRPPSAAVIEQWNLAGKLVIGYIGSFNDYEGLDRLIEAADRLRARAGDAFRVLLVGDGNVRPELEALVRRLGLGGVVLFTGRVPHARVADHYSVIDVFAFPRKPLAVCEAVSPLKPFEAMASGKLVVASRVRALAEIVSHDRTGLLCRPDDADSLADALELALTRPERRAELAAAGLAWVREHRSWAAIGERIAAVYGALSAASAPR